MVSSLNDLNEEGWSILEGLGEDLKNVTLLVVVTQDVQGLDLVDVFLNCDGAVLKFLT